MPAGGNRREAVLYYVLFFLSGFPALLYQIVWQRALFSVYGINIESVTVIVTAFMLGLGIGSLAGGKLSKVRNLPLLAVFGGIEVGIALFGVCSLAVFHRIASLTAGASAPKTGLITFSLLLFPTMLMGSTLPLLVEHFVGVTKNVGESVGLLYSVNTFGSAAACFAAALVVMRALGESGSVRFAAALNTCVGCSALVLHTIVRPRRQVTHDPAVSPMANGGIPFPIGLVLSAAVGFISLAYEIVWYRLYSFVSGGAARSFALLLGFYLTGIAYGSLAVRVHCRNRLRKHPDEIMSTLAGLILWAGLIAYLIGPLLAGAVKYLPYPATLPLALVGATLLGAAFPLVSHASISPEDQAGSKLSFLYIANIIGAASGSFVVGFVLMEHWSIRQISLALLAAGTVSAALLLVSNGKRHTLTSKAGFAAAAALAAASGPLFSMMYERLYYKQEFIPALAFRHVIETRSGVITVTQDGTVCGGGIYDGRFNTDLVRDTNGIFRAFAVPALHPQPSEVLMIGLSSGSWAQVVVSNPDVKHLTIVEINPGYLRLIPQYPAVADLLRNPKVDIVIDDGHRWLLRNPDRKFDLVIMNTTYHWRAHCTNLLSVEFLRLIRSHLKPGGIHYYNTTGSGEALHTGAAVFPHALRVWNFLAVSDSPIRFDKSRWEEHLAAYRISDKPIFDLSDPAQVARLKEVLSLADSLNTDPKRAYSLEDADSLRRRLADKRIITDDNMGTEWM